jgi:hypothetical protein
VDGVIDGEGGNSLLAIRWVVASPCQNGTHGYMDGFSPGDASEKSGSHLSEVHGAGVHPVGAFLQVAWVSAGLTVNHARMGGGHYVAGFPFPEKFCEESFQGFCEKVETHGVIHEGLNLRTGQGFEIGKKTAGTGEVSLCLLVIPWVDAIIGPLEKTFLHVGHEF